MSCSEKPDWDKFVYRVRGFPDNFGPENLSGAIQEAYHILPEDFKIHSLSLDIAEGCMPRHKVATVTFRSKPIALGVSKNQEWSFEIAPSSDTNANTHRTYLDTHFKGFTPLTPEKNDETCDIDCVFVHGWGNNALGSLIADDPTYIWLRDDLPSKLPALRIWTYGYGSQITDENHISDPFEDAEGLKHDLRSFRDPSERDRSIIFIVHSLGGLVFKQAMISMSRSNNVHDKQNIKLIKGALFFGVPGQGMDVTTLASMVNGRPSQYTLNLLDENIGFRQRDIQDEDFYRIWHNTGFNIVSFFERRKTPTYVKTANGWKRTGPPCLLVKSSSATSSRYSSRGSDNMIALDKDHSSMVKFSRNDHQDYRKVWKALQYLIDNTQNIVQERVGSQDLPTEREREIELQQSFIHDLYEEILRSRTRQIAEAANGTYEWIFHDSNDQDNDKEALDEEARNNISLNNEASIVHEAHIRKQEEETRDRVSKPPANKDYDGEIGDFSSSMERSPKRQKLSTYESTGFSEWLRSGHGIYWITGKPGSGKSTLIKFIIQHPKTKTALQQWADGADIVTASFYFWISGAQLQRSLIGLLQSIFHQILDHDHSLIQALFPREWWRYTKQSKPVQWTEDSFLDAIDSLKGLEQPQKHKFCFFIDGLDEYKGDKDLGWLCRLLLELGSLPHIKLCISSRYWADFQLMFSRCPTLKLHDWTRNDIYRFINQELTKHSFWTELCEVDPVEAESIIRQVSQGAEGVFLWVFLVVRLLIKGNSITNLLTRLSTIPKTLDEFFARMITDLPDDDHDLVIKALSLARLCYGFGASLAILVLLEDGDLAAKRSIPFHAQSLNTLRSTCIRTERCIETTCCDLLEIQRSDKDRGELNFAYARYVSFTHRTLTDYLDSSKGSALLVLHDGSHFDVTAWFDEALLVLYKTFPTNAANVYVLRYVYDLYSIWIHQTEDRADYKRKTLPDLRYVQELDKAIIAVLEAISVDTTRYVQASDDYLTLLKFPHSDQGLRNRLMAIDYIRYNYSWRDTGFE